PLVSRALRLARVGAGGQVSLGGEESLLGHCDGDLGRNVVGRRERALSQDRSGDRVEGVGVALAQSAGVVLGWTRGCGLDRELEPMASNRVEKAFDSHALGAGKQSQEATGADCLVGVLDLGWVPARG